MARPREFEESKAISDAMNVFWQHGYDGASINMLLSGMGMTKGSLYKAFTDKKSLFLKAMARYEAEQVTPAVDILRDSATRRHDRIALLFRSIPAAVRNGDRRGCLLCSAAAGPASDDEEIAEVVDGLLAQMKGGFEAAMDPALAEEKRAQLARLLVTQYVGLRILARAQISVDELDKSVASLLDMLASDGN